MRIVFIGAVKFSLSALQYLVSINAEIVGICTLSQSKGNSDYVDLADFASQHQIPWIHVDDINSQQSLNWITNKSPDIVFCFGWSRLLKEDLLELAPLGVVGFHPAALPANRGRHPIIWALVLGLEKTASTFFIMDADADSGDIISQREITIDELDDAGSLYEKITNTALEQIREFLPLLGTVHLPRVVQDERGASWWRKRGFADGQIDWRMSARSIHNLVQALAKPYSGAHFMNSGEMIKVWKTTVYEGSPKNAEPGKILAYSDSGPIVKCGEGAICLMSTEPHFVPVEGSYL